MNQVQLLGRLTKEPNFKKTEDGTAIANYCLAVPKRFSKEDKVDFISCTAFNKDAEFAANYFHKGQRVAILGHLQNNNYTNKDGIKVFTTEVIIESQEFADGTGAYGISEDGLFASIKD